MTLAMLKKHTYSKAVLKFNSDNLKPETRPNKISSKIKEKYC